MSYALLSDDLLLRLESAGISRDARLLHIEGIVYSATALQDGLIPIRLERISDADDVASCSMELIAAGLWERSDNAFRIVNYLSSEGGHQRSAAQVERDREANRKRQDDYRERGRRHTSGDHSMCGKSCPAVRNGVTNGVTNGVSNAAQSSPLLSVGKGERGESGKAVALRRSGQPLGPTDSHYYFSHSDDDAAPCDYCGLSGGDERHTWIGAENALITEDMAGIGAHPQQEACYSPVDGDTPAQWCLPFDLGDMAIYAYSINDATPHGWAGLSSLTVVFTCSPPEHAAIVNGLQSWPDTEANLSEHGVCAIEIGLDDNSPPISELVESIANIRKDTP